MGLITQPIVLTNDIVQTAASATTASVVAPPNKLLFLAVKNSLNTTGSANLPSVSGLGITWHEVATHPSTFNSGQHRITFFVGVVTSNQTGTLSITFGGQTQKIIAWSLIEFPQNVYIDPSNPQNAIIQTANAENPNNTFDTSLTVTLGAFANPNNATIGILATDGTTPIPGGNFTTITGQGIFSGYLNVEFAGNNQQSVNWSWSNDAVAKVALACEIKCLVMGAGGVVLL